MAKIYYETELYHYGIPGMKWGHRKAQAIKSYMNKKRATKEEYRKNKGPKRGLVNAANSAARTYYRKERTKDFRTYRKAEKKLDLKVARLTDEQVKDGRYRVARARNIKRKTVSSIVGTTVGIAAISAGAGFIGIPIATISGVATNYASGGHYYSQQQRAYGGARAKYAIKTEEQKRKVNK